MDLSTKLHAVDGFIKMINKNCKTINEINLNTFNLRMFITSPRSWMEGVIYQGHDEWLQCMRLVNNKLEENNDILIQIENEIWQAKNSSKQFHSCVNRKKNISKPGIKTGLLNLSILKKKLIKCFLNLITHH